MYAPPGLVCLSVLYSTVLVQRHNHIPSPGCWSIVQVVKLLVNCSLQLYAVYTVSSRLRVDSRLRPTMYWRRREAEGLYGTSYSSTIHTSTSRSSSTWVHDHAVQTTMNIIDRYTDHLFDKLLLPVLLYGCSTRHGGRHGGLRYRYRRILQCSEYTT